MTKNKLNVFVSYSHKDKAWLERVQVHLKPLARDGRLELWDDTRIKNGQRWRDEIKATLGQADVAILLISADFYASDFIANNELPPLLETAQSECGLVILGVHINYSDFENDKRLSEYQTVNTPNQPIEDLESRGQQEKVFRDLARRIRELVEPLNPPPPVVAVVVKSVDELIADLTSKDPLVAMDAANGLAERPGIITPDIITKVVERANPSMEPIPLAAVRRVLASDPEASAQLLCERVLSGDRDWHPARQAAHDLDVSHRPYCQDSIGKTFDRAGRDLTRILFWALGNLGANDWRFAAEERFYRDPEKYAGYALDGFTHLFLHAGGREARGASDSLRAAIERDAENPNRQGLNRLSFRVTLRGCTGDHVDVLVNDWLESGHPLVRELAADVLGDCRFERSIPALERRLRDDDDDNVKSSAAIALGTIATPEALEASLRHGARPHAFALHLVPDDSDFIRHATELKEQSIFRWTVWRAIGLRRAKDFLTVLRGVAGTGDFLERGCALLALARCGEPQDHRRIIAAHREASSDEQLLTTLALLTIAPERYPQVEPNLRDRLAAESYMLWHPLREDIIAVLEGVGSEEAKHLADAWRPFYGHLDA